MTAAISRMSSSTMPRVVSAGVPMRRPGGVHRRALVEGDRVAVDGDPDLLEAVLGGLAVEPGRGQVDEHEVDVGAAGEDRDAALLQALGERLGVGDRLALAGAELLAGGDLQRDGLGGDRVHQRPALLAGEDRFVDRFRVLLAAEDHAAARAAEGLVDRRRDDVGVRHRVGVLAGGDQAGEVGHVDHQLGPDRVGDLAEGGEVELARVGGPAGDDHLRLVLLGEARDLVHVDAAGPRGARGTATGL